MKLDISPIFISGFNCLENSFHSILEWKSITYERAFIESWPFTMNNADCFMLLGDRLNTMPAIETADKYVKYCGIGYKTYKNGCIADPFAIIKTDIAKESPVLLMIDIFYCPWANQYHKQHAQHFCAITGIDDNNIYCLDANLLTRDGSMCKNEFLNNYDAIFTLGFFDKNTGLPDLKSNLNKCIDGLGLFSENNNTFMNLRNFADSFEKANLENEAEGFSNIGDIPLFIGIIRIYGSRYQIKKFMEFLQNNYDDEILQYLIERFSNVLIQWASIKSLTSKAFILNDKNILFNISNRIRRATDIEENIARTIYDYIHDKPLCLSNDYKKVDVVKEFLFLDLSKYYNNKGFEGENASFSRTSEYFLAKDLPSSPVWSIENMKFKFPKINYTYNDNISCMGQVIECDHGRFSHIMLLYCAEYGSFIENIEICYKDGTKELVEYTASDWYGEPAFLETIVWSGMVASDLHSVTGKRNIFAKSLDINKDKKVVTSIILPNCVNIHIFSITLA